MKDDFLKELFTSARETANDLLGKAEQLLREVEEDFLDPEDEVESLRFERDSLQARLEELEDINDDLVAGIQLLLDGEVRKEITMSWERYNNLRDSDLEIIHTDDTVGNVTITINQDR